MILLPYYKRPKVLQTDLVIGVCVGGCIHDINKPTDQRLYNHHTCGVASAHAHLDNDVGYAGWICVFKPEHLDCQPLMLHELAHILTGQQHTDHWRKILLDIGGTLDEIPGVMQSYHKKTKSKI